MEPMTDSRGVTMDELTIWVKLEKKTMELFTIPVPRRQQKFLSMNSTQVRVLDNPQEDGLRNYVVWGKIKWSYCIDGNHGAIQCAPAKPSHPQ